MSSPNVTAAVCLMLSMAGFTINDSILKSINGEINTGQILLVRGMFASFLLVLLAYRQGALKFGVKSIMTKSGVFNPLVGFRAACEVFATLCFLQALIHLPFANISAILQALPLTVTLGAALFFGEPVGWRRWLAIMVGMLGVIIIVRPGMSGFNSYSLVALGVVLFATGRDLVTRRLPTNIPSVLVSIVTSVVITITGALLVQPFGGWRPMDGLLLLKLASAGVFIVAGYQFIILAMRIGEIASVAPFRYTSLIWAIALGYLFFAEVPDSMTLLGALLVVSTGLFTLYRERKLSRSAR